MLTTYRAAKAYLDRRVSEGKSRREAHRALKRFVVRAIWKLWQECQQNERQQFAKSPPHSLEHRSVASCGPCIGTQPSMKQS